MVRTLTAFVNLRPAATAWSSPEALEQVSRDRRLVAVRAVMSVHKHVGLNEGRHVSGRID